MKRATIMIPLVVCIGALTSMRCSLTSGPLAGGSGLGNPPTNVAFAMAADTDLIPELSKRAAGASPLVNNPSGRRLNIKDQSGLAYTVASAKVAVDFIRFVVAAPESLSYLTLGQGLICDKTGIVITGPFVFDVINNTVVPPLDQLKLPSISYLGVEMLFIRKDSLNTVEITGDFVYLNTAHGFVFSLAGDKLGKYVKQDSFLLEGKHPAAIIVRLNASTWLDSVDLGSCLDKGWIGFDSNGVLVVDGKMPQGCNKYNTIIQDNIINSGRLEIKK